MSSVPTFPLELQHSIIDCVAEPDGSDRITQTLRTCSLVSRSWHAGAQRWILQRLHFTIHFTDAPNKEAARQNEVIKGFLAFLTTKPEVKRYIESLHLNIRSTAARALSEHTCSPSPKRRIGELAVELKDVIREVGLSFSSPDLIFESDGVKRRLLELCTGSKLEIIYLNNTIVPSTLLAQCDVKTLVLDDCTGVVQDMSDRRVGQHGIQEMALRSEKGIGRTIDTLVVHDSKRRPVPVFEQLWKLVQRREYTKDLLSRVKSLDVCLTKSIPISGAYDRVLYSNHLQSLTLSYTASFYLDDGVHARFSLIPWVSLVRLSDLKITIEFVKVPLSNSSLHSTLCYSAKPLASSKFLQGAASLCHLKTFSLVYAFTNARFETTLAIKHALKHTCTKALDRYFALGGKGFERLENFLLGVGMIMRKDQPRSLKDEDALADCMRDALPAVFGDGGRVMQGLNVALCPSIWYERISGAPL